MPRLPKRGQRAAVDLGGTLVELTNLEKPFFPEAGLTKGDLLQYYADVAPALLPHLRDRAMVMKRYPDGAGGPFFFMKRTPSYKPDWLETVPILHGSGSVIAFPVVQDLASLLWVVNLGCIDLNPWYGRGQDVDHPDFLNFDLDPGPGVPFAQVREVALVVRAALLDLGMTPYPKTTGSRGIHVYVPIAHGPTQKQVWRYAKALAQRLEAEHPRLVTARYRIEDRPAGRVLVDYNQNAWGRTLASVYSVRPTAGATVSMPLTWTEVDHGVEIADFHLGNAPRRVRELGDLWRPLLDARGRFDLAATAPAEGAA